jgi:hypothetical protein
MWWTYVLVGGAGLILGFLLAATVVAKERSDARDDEEFYKAMREYRAKHQKDNDKQQ